MSHLLGAPDLGNDYADNVAMGLVPGVTSFIMSGVNTDVDSGVAEDIITQGGFYQWPTAAETIDVSSSNAGDMFASIGCNTLLIIGLDITGAIIQETVNMNGTTVVTTATSFYRVNTCLCTTGGGAETNLGVISLIGSVSGFTLGEVVAGEGQMTQAVYTVPAGVNAVILGGVFSATRSGGGTPILNFKGRVRVDGTSIWRSAFNDEIDLGVADSKYLRQFSYPALPPLTDLRIEIDSNTNNTTVFCRLYIRTITI